MNAELARSAYRYLLPAGLRRAILVRRRARYWLSAGIVFIHVPKAAGTSFNHALYGRFIGHPRALDVARWAPSSVKALPSFSVTRNPWDRLVSAYRFARAGLGLGEKRAGMWRAGRYKVPEFESFERFVREWLAARDVNKLDGVFQPQSLFLCDRSGRPLLDHIGKLEDLEPTYAFIAAHRAPIERLERTNVSGDAVDYRRFYSPELAQLVGDIYRHDVDRFGYDF